MAQSTAGIKLYYGTMTGTDFNTAPTDWTEIPDVTSIPALGGEPNMLDVTVLSETEQKHYIAGLKDGGGSMQYSVLMTPAMLTATDAAAALKGKCAFKIEFPAPLNCYYWYKGDALPVMPGEAEVDGVLSSTFYTSVETTPVKVAING